MTTIAKTLELPLHLVGISDQVAGWLRQAGVPVVALGQDSALKSAFGLKSRATQTMASPVRCLLFDSRDLWSRSVVKAYQKNSFCKIDAAALLKSNGKGKRGAKNGTSARSVFLEGLKKLLESQGGLWARLADFPFPYQGVGCLNAGPHSQSANRLDEIQQKYIAGLPVMISATDLSGLADLPPVTGLQSPGLPLLWRAESTDFARWWQHRNQLQVTLWQTSTHYHVNCSRSSTAFCPVLEIWRGSHLASVPLRAESIVVRKDGLVFQQQPLRHPAGFTAVWPETTSDAGISYLSA